MPLPDNFSQFEHLQDVFRKVANREVANFFSDLGDSWEPSLTPDRSGVRTACTHQDNDSGTMTIIRTLLLYLQLGYIRNGLVLFYGSRENQEPTVAGHPKINFYFSQDMESVPSGANRADLECSFRLMEYKNTSSNLKTKLLQIGAQIKTEFVDAKKGIVLTKGNLLVSYKDPENGFPSGSKILCNSASEAIDIYQRMCRVGDIAFNDDLITVHDPKKPSTSGTNSGTQTILGKSRKKRSYRRVVNVRYRYAYATIPGEPNPVFLHDTTGRYITLAEDRIS